MLTCCGNAVLSPCRRLDYDRLPDHTYNFTVTATDNGVPALSGSANVRVSVTNVNDEDPVFVQSTVELIQVSEDALPNTVIHVLQAYDPDGDGVTYSFAGNSPQRFFFGGIIRHGYAQNLLDFNTDIGLYRLKLIYSSKRFNPYYCYLFNKPMLKFFL